MSKTIVPLGEVIRYRYRNDWEYSRIVPLNPAHLGVCETCEADDIAIQVLCTHDSDLPVGTRVFQGVWVGPKRETFEVRRTYVTK